MAQRDPHRAERQSGRRQRRCAAHAGGLHPGEGAAGKRRRRRGDPADRAGVRLGAAGPRGGGWASRSQHRGAIETLRRRRTCSTTSPATSARRCGSAPIWTAGDGYGATLALLEPLDQGGAPGRHRARGQPGLQPARAAGFEAKFKKAAFKVSTSLFLDETAAALRPAAPQPPRAGALGRSPAPARA